MYACIHAVMNACISTCECSALPVLRARSPSEIERNNFIVSAYEGGVSAVDLATMFQLSRQMVHRIVNNTIAVNKSIEKRVLGPSTYAGSKNHATT